MALIADKSCEPILTEAITDTNTDNEARAQAARGLGKIATPTAIATLVKTLTDDDLKLRSAAVAALARAGQSDSVRTRQSTLKDLMAALRDPNPALKLGANSGAPGYSRARSQCRPDRNAAIRPGHS